VEDVPLDGRPAQVEVLPQYSRGLLEIDKNSHLWLLLWFHQSNRNCLTSVPAKVNPFLHEFGVFGLRSPNRPNPIALYLVHLDSVEGNILNVSGLDAFDGTPVLDIKSYYERDIVFSPTTPYIRVFDPIMRQDSFFRQALAHHQEACPDLHLAVRMGLIADEFMGHLNTPDLEVIVTGSACLADALQGLSRARLANPRRFAFHEDLTVSRSQWERPGRSLTITVRQHLPPEHLIELPDVELFHIEHHES
jgi:tRNA-Thr(GGU) m(6)t(6)A37 methyltransferase TsaA